MAGLSSPKAWPQLFRNLHQTWIEGGTVFAPWTSLLGASDRAHRVSRCRLSGYGWSGGPSRTLTAAFDSDNHIAVQNGRDRGKNTDASRRRSAERKVRYLPRLLTRLGDGARRFDPVEVTTISDPRDRRAVGHHRSPI
jgi:hypothetical protein